MDYQVSGRKYRPSMFDDVIGQPHVVQMLVNAITAKRIAHAFLFSETRGVGKTTVARLLAKALNCERGPTSTPCGKCPNCLEIAQGISVDVIEIDGASNTGVDDVRELRENVKFAPFRGHYRIYIIDEVHMLSNSAFNALLKTLEEPPAHVVFIFATTEIHKIPTTILSRCQHFTFRRIPRREVVDTLKRVTAAEGITIDERSLSALARASDGSLRDALSLLDQAVAFGGKRVEAEQLMVLLGAVPHELLRGALEAVLTRDAAGALKALAAVQDHGCDVRQFCGELMEHVRNLLVARIVPDAGDLIELGPDEQAEIKADAARLTLEHIQELFRVFLQAEDGIRASQYPWFVVEMAAVRASRVGQEQATPAPARPETKVAPAPPKLAPQAAPLSKASEPGPASAPQAERPQPVREAPPPPPARPEPVNLDWEAVVARILAERPNIGAFLEESGLVGAADDLVTIGFPASAGTAMRMMQQESYQQAVAEVCSALAGRPLRLHVVSLEGGAGAPTAAQLRQEREATRERHLRDEALTNPLVQEALSVFGGEVKEVRHSRAPLEPEGETGR